MIATFVVLSALVVVGTQRTLTSEAFAQQPIHSDHTREEAHPNHSRGQVFEPLIDGSLAPASVPDTAAIRVLMQTLRVPPNPEAKDLDQLRAQVDRVNLSDADFAVLVSELSKLDARARDQQEFIEAVRPSSAEASEAAITRYVEEQKKLGAILVDHYQQILASLSPAGAENLQQHLLHVKSRIRIYPTPNMPAGSN